MPTTSPKELLVDESTVTSRGQTTIPSSIRKVLDLGPADKIRYAVRDDNTVVLTRSTDHDDPVVSEFLAFLEADMRASAVNIRPVPNDLLTRAGRLTEGVTVDLDAPLDSDDE